MIVKKKWIHTKIYQDLNIYNVGYYIDSLPQRGKGLVNGIRTADAQLKIYEVTLKMISIW